MLKRPPIKYVYLFHAVGTNLFKIGVSKNILNRKRTIRTTSPYPIEFICYYPSDNAHQDEIKLHKLFEHRRQHGEWFEFDSINHAQTLFEEFFIIRNQHFPNYEKILQNLESDIHRDFLDLVTNLVFVKDSIVVILVYSNNRIILDMIEGIRFQLTVAVATELNRHVELYFIQITEPNLSENRAINTIISSELMKFFVQNNDDSEDEEVIYSHVEIEDKDLDVIEDELKQTPQERAKRFVADGSDDW